MLKSVKSLESEKTIYFAVEIGDIEMTRFFIKNGACVNSINKEGETVLQTALKNHNFEIATYLVHNGAECKNLTKEQQLLLLKYFISHEDNSSACKVIEHLNDFTPLTEGLKKNSQYRYNDKNNQPKTLDILQIPKDFFLHSCLEGKFDLAQKLVDLGLDINLVFDHQYRSMSFMLADKTVTDWASSTMLHIAVDLKKQDLLEFLIKNNIDLDKLNQHNFAAIHIAAFKNYFNILDLLASNGANVNIQDPLGKVALNYSVEKNYHLCTTKLLEEKANASLLTCLQKLELFQKLCFEEKYKAARQIIDSGGDINALIEYEPSKVKYTHLGGTKVSKIKAPLIHIAIDQDRFGILEFLLENGAYIDARDEFSKTPLMIAAILSDDKIFNFLVKNGANIEQKSISGFSILQICARNNDHKMVKLIVQLGADVNYVSPTGVSAADMAYSFGHFKLVQELFLRGAIIDKSYTQTDNRKNAINCFFDKQQKALESLQKFFSKDVKDKTNADALVSNIGFYEIKFLHQLFKHISLNIGPKKDFLINNGAISFSINEEELHVVKKIFKQYYQDNYFEIHGICKSLNGNEVESQQKLENDLEGTKTDGEKEKLVPGPLSQMPTEIIFEISSFLVGDFGENWVNFAGDCQDEATNN